VSYSIGLCTVPRRPTYPCMVSKVIASEKFEIDRDYDCGHRSNSGRSATPRRNLMKTIVAALTAAFLISGAYAQSPSSPPGKAPSADASTAPMAKSDAKRDMGVESHIKDLHAKLKITAA